MTALSESTSGARLVACVGPGGVGKTTVAAALGVAAARRGERVFVLTIDPAKRLADALGIGLSDKAVRVPLEAPGELYAAMVDTKSSYDALIRRVAASEADIERILGNPVYDAFSRTLARSHAYAAAERVYHALEHDHYDTIVLDTPPLRSALDILDAPGRLTSFLESGVVRAMLEPSAGPLSRLLPSGGAAVRRLLSLAASQRLTDQLVGFFAALSDLGPGFLERAERVRQLLTSSGAAFVMVCSPAPTSLDDAAYMRDGLAERDIPLRACVVNRAFVGEPRDPSRPLRASEVRLGEVPEELAEARAELALLRAQVAARNRQAEARIRDFAHQLSRTTRLFVLPEMLNEVGDVAHLERLSTMLEHAEHRRDLIHS